MEYILLELSEKKVLFATVWTVDHQPSLSWDYPSKNIEVSCHFLLQGIFSNRVSNPHFLHAGEFFMLSHQEAPVKELVEGNFEALAGVKKTLFYFHIQLVF